MNSAEIAVDSFLQKPPEVGRHNDEPTYISSLYGRFGIIKKLDEAPLADQDVSVDSLPPPPLHRPRDDQDIEEFMSTSQTTDFGDILESLQVDNFSIEDPNAAFSGYVPSSMMHGDLDIADLVSDFITDLEEEVQASPAVSDLTSK